MVGVYPNANRRQPRFSMSLDTSVLAVIECEGLTRGLTPGQTPTT